MGRLLRNNLSVVLWVAAVILATGLLFCVYAGVSFGVRTVRAGYAPDLIKQEEIATFNLTGAAELKKLRGK